MCGIVGHIAMHGSAINNVETVEAMMLAQNHRGPDDKGICAFNLYEKSVISHKSADEFCGKRNFSGIMGFNRLSILDLSDNGHQPMLSENKDIIICFNGEIYNAFDYTDMLSQRGYIFKSHTDTEVILKLYLEYGLEEMLQKLNGMFAIAIMDLRCGKFFLARDRFGIKPCYYTFYNNRLVYASEIKSIIADDSFTPEINTENLYENYIYSGTTDHCLLKHVYQLQPGEVLQYSLYDDKISSHFFFDIDSYIRPKKSEKSQRQYMEELEQLINEAVQRQKISDVKLGCQLSGGIDSTLITTFANIKGDRPLKDAISVIFDKHNNSYSEEIYMDNVISKLGLDAHKLVLDKSYVADNLEKTIWHLDMLANTPNAIGIMLLSKEAKKYVTVLLSGEGADEVFGGYWQFSKAPLMLKADHLLKTPLGGLANKLLHMQGEQLKAAAYGYAGYVARTHGVQSEASFNKMFEGHLDTSDIYYKQIRKREEMFNSYKGSDFDKHIKYKMQTNLPDLLVRQDKMSMSCSIENRVPMLDNRVVDYAFSIPEKILLPWSFKEHDTCIGGYSGKNILKEICKKYYGKDFAYRRKRGFDLPLADFLSHDSFSEYFYDALYPKMEKRQICNAKNIKAMYKNIKHINAEEANMLWKAINIEIWAQLFVDKKMMKG